LETDWVAPGAAVTAWFGEYALDDSRRELLHRGAPVHLTPKAYALLQLLLERRPAAVSKAEIHDRIWPGTFVSEVNLATLVFEIRAAVGDASSARCAASATRSATQPRDRRSPALSRAGFRTTG